MKTCYSYDRRTNWLQSTIRLTSIIREPTRVAHVSHTHTYERGGLPKDGSENLTRWALRRWRGDGMAGRWPGMDATQRCLPPAWHPDGRHRRWLDGGHPGWRPPQMAPTRDGRCAHPDGRAFEMARRWRAERTEQGKNWPLAGSAVRDPSVCHCIGSFAAQSRDCRTHQPGCTKHINKSSKFRNKASFSSVPQQSPSKRSSRHASKGVSHACAGPSCHSLAVCKQAGCR